MQPSLYIPVQEYFKIRNFTDVPIPQYQRKRTDVFCTIISTLFVIIMFTTACFCFNKDTLSRWAYPSDSIGRVCGRDNAMQPFMYFVSAFDTSKRVCLSQCPQINDNKVHSYPLDCFPNVVQDTHIQIYDSQPQETIMGKFCFPTNPRIKEMLLMKSGIVDRYRILKASNVILYSLLVALALGIIYMLFVQFIPEIMISVSVIIGGVVMILIGGILFAYQNQISSNMTIFKYVLGTAFILFGIALLGMLYYCGRQLKTIGVFLRLAGRFVKNRPIIFLVIVVFLLLIAILVMLFVFQFLAFFSMGFVSHSAQSPYYQLTSNWKLIILHLLNIIQFFWGLNFLREASVFIISGLVVEWYTHRTVNPLKNLILYHWGSVAACSFMVGFFGIPDMIYLLLTPQPGKMRLDYCGRMCSAIASPFESISMYIREEAMTYINLTGIPYCNASVFSQYLNWQSFISRGKGSRPIMRYYRYGAYSFLVSLVVVFGTVSQISTIGVVPFLSILVIWVLGLYVLSGFVDVHADAASALMITLMLEEQLEGSIDNLKCVPPQFIAILKSPRLN